MAKKKVEEVTHSPKFDKVKSYYDKSLWNKIMVHNAVIKSWITPEEYEEITGEPYIESEQLYRGKNI